MRYLTKACFEEIQAAHCVLTFPETEEEWKQEIVWFEAEGIDYPECRRHQLERWKDAVLRLVPAAWHPLVEDGTLVTVYPSEELRQMLNRLQADFDARLKALREAYRHHLAAIKGSLPQGVIQLVEKTPHDARIRSIERPAPERLVMTLDCDGAMFYDEDIRLAFTGVRRVEGELPPPGSLWLTEEVFLAEDAGEGFELHILFDGPLAEFTLSAADVEVSFLG